MWTYNLISLKGSTLSTSTVKYWCVWNPFCLSHSAGKMNGTFSIKVTESLGVYAP